MPPAAYYLIGYAVECGLKACVLKHLASNPDIIFEEGRRRFSDRCWTHNLEELVDLASLGLLRVQAEQANTKLATNWLIVKDWNESARYERRSQTEADELFDAVTNDPDGVLPWIKSHW